MSDLRIRNGHPSEVMQEDRRQATEALAIDLRRKGYDVELEIVERVPGTYGLSQIEWTTIEVVAEGAASGIIGKMAGDAYEAAKKRLRARRDAQGGSGRHLGVTILGPDGKPIKSWSTKDDDDS